jgi:TIR domain
VWRDGTGGATVKVFISWSGEPSRSIARTLTGWLESVVQHVDAWMSDEEIGSGARWSDAIAESLDETNVGIVCVTQANQHAPWLIFEAGALAKSVKVARVVPLCIDLGPSEVTGPLAAFQGRSFDEDGMRRLVYDLNEALGDAGEKQMTKELLADVFDAMWRKLDAAVAKAVEGAPAAQGPRRSVDDMLAEVVERLRRVERSVLQADQPDLEEVSKWVNVPPRSGKELAAVLTLLNATMTDTDLLLAAEERQRKAARKAALERRAKRSETETTTEPAEDDSEQSDEDGGSAT